jgi:hypothetical protein
MDFSEIVVNGIPLALVVMALVELVKELGVEGKALTASSFAIGLILGVLYQMTVAIPVDFAGWFGAVVFGLGLGLVASKGYDAIRSAAQTAK